MSSKIDGQAPRTPLHNGAAMPGQPPMEATMIARRRVEAAGDRVAQLNQLKRQLERELVRLQGATGDRKMDSEKVVDDIRRRIAEEESRNRQELEDGHNQLQTARRKKSTVSDAPPASAEPATAGKPFVLYFDMKRCRYRVTALVANDCGPEDLTHLKIAASSSAHLGQGGQGIVVRAFDEELGADVVLKIIRPREVVEGFGEAPVYLDDAIKGLRASLKELGVPLAESVPSGKAEKISEFEGVRFRLHSVLEEARRLGGRGFERAERDLKVATLRLRVERLYVQYREHLEKSREEIMKLGAIGPKPNVLRCLGCGSTYFDDDPSIERQFVVFDYMPGGDLRSHLEKRFPKTDRIGPVDFLNYATGVSRGLSAVHGVGVVHRDVKPGNTFLCGDQVFLGDLGNYGTKSRGIPADRFAFSRENLPPEVVPLLRTPGATVQPAFTHDIWALGALLFEMATLRQPIALPGDSGVTGKSSQQELYEALSDLKPFPDVRLINPKMTQEINALIQKCLAKNPEDRYQDMEQVLKALQEIRAGMSSSGSRPGVTGLVRGVRSLFRRIVGS